MCKCTQTQTGSNGFKNTTMTQQFALHSITASKHRGCFVTWNSHCIVFSLPFLNKNADENICYANIRRCHIRLLDLPPKNRPPALILLQKQDWVILCLLNFILTNNIYHWFLQVWYEKKLLCAPNRWNNLPKDLRGAGNVDIFTPKSNSYLFSLAFM